MAINSLAVLDRLVEAVSEIGRVKAIDYVSNAPEAIEWLSLFEPDVLVVEVQLRGGSGIEVLKHAKVSGVGSKVIVVTDAPYLEYKDACLGLGADHFFDIAREFESFRSAIEELGERQASRMRSSMP